jgi:hypothetical protein
LEGGQQLNYISRKNYLQKIKKQENRLRKDDKTSKDGDASTVGLNRSGLSLAKEVYLIGAKLCRANGVRWLNKFLEVL